VRRQDRRYVQRAYVRRQDRRHVDSSESGTCYRTARDENLSKTLVAKATCVVCLLKRQSVVIPLTLPNNVCLGESLRRCRDPKPLRGCE
jgi:hypothetical protein